ncbi:unnamed protein product [Paramecium octaurelia]|uniref:Uncharacterized protein n=1 Tax=Paramecium octaurelia TaxID=43137 RepID=A0A8S1X9N7_PAROT|nr:unnamed protein product [Paramecium octaurelia]
MKNIHFLIQLRFNWAWHIHREDSLELGYLNSVFEEFDRRIDLAKTKIGLKCVSQGYRDSFLYLYNQKDDIRNEAETKQQILNFTLDIKQKA